MKIDFVVPWVDGSDEKWLKDRINFSSEKIIKNDYRDWDIFKYWFRSIEKYAPWVNKIYFITYGHIPYFLNINHPKIVIIKHEDYIPKQYLPTFSSHTIELNLHRIKNLSENFVYFNDDTFILKPLKENDFFKNNLPKATAIINPVAPSRYDTISNLMINNTGLINQHFKKHKTIKHKPFNWFNYKYGIFNLLNLLFIPWSKFPGFFEDHIPSSFNKKTYETLWEKEFDILDKTCRNKVRNFKVDVNQWLMKNWQIASNNFYPKSKKTGIYITIEKMNDAIKVSKILNSKKYKFLCINDHLKIGDKIKEDEIIEFIKKELENKFYEKSSFEK